LTVRFDSVGGASGDLILSSLCALGVNHIELQRRLELLRVGHFSLKVKSVSERGFRGKRLSVAIPHSHGHHCHGQINS